MIIPLTPVAEPNSRQPPFCKHRHHASLACQFHLTQYSALALRYCRSAGSCWLYPRKPGRRVVRHQRSPVAKQHVLSSCLLTTVN